MTHDQLKKQYALDATRTSTPWLYYEFFNEAYIQWIIFDDEPSWDVRLRIRRHDLAPDISHDPQLHTKAGTESGYIGDVFVSGWLTEEPEHLENVYFCSLLSVTKDTWTKHYTGTFTMLLSNSRDKAFRNCRFFPYTEQGKADAENMLYAYQKLADGLHTQKKESWFDKPLCWVGSKLNRSI